MMNLNDLVGHELGSKTLNYSVQDTMLYAIAVGSDSKQLDLVYERDLRALPCYACALGLWAVEAAGELGAYDRKRSLHAAQSLVMHAPLPVNGPIDTRGKITEVWDKGKAAVVNIEVESEVFTAAYSIFLPGLGGWGGERGPSSTKSAETPEVNWQGRFNTLPSQASLYRLTGDFHPIHIDTEVAEANGFERPILHGLCTLGIVVRELADACNAHPAELKELSARLAAPVLPGDDIEISATVSNNTVSYQATVNGTAVLKDGHAVF